MLLGEPLVTKETWNSELAKMALASVRANLSILYDSEPQTLHSMNKRQH